MRRLLLLLTLASLPLQAFAAQEPAYKTVCPINNVEVRQYAPSVVAEVVLDASAEDAGNQAFPILAGCIFGKNKGQKKFAIPAPVTPAAAPMRMVKTAPVTQAAEADVMRVQIVLPKGVTLETAPEPLDTHLQPRTVAASSWAVIRYSGIWSQSNHQEHRGVLRTTLEAADSATQGEPALARYNAPMTAWFLRRNEVWLALR